MTKSRIEEIKDKISYDPETGLFHWKGSGKQAGHETEVGYVLIQIENIRFWGHHLAWLLTYGEIADLDHKNRFKWDNRIANLRKTNRSLNAANRASPGNNTGFKGVYYRESKDRYEVGIKVNQKRIHLGVFHDLEEAQQAYMEAAIFYFGEFAYAD